MLSKFQPGEQVHIRLVFGTVVPVRGIYVIFVHEEDPNAHVVIGFESGAADGVMRPASQRLVDIDHAIEHGQKPGVYHLDRISFETFGGNTLDQQGDLKPASFEVILEHVVSPTVEDVSIFTQDMWQTAREVERRG